MKVAIFGLGYVGAVTAACLAREGHDVFGVDIDTNKVALINAGGAPVVEPGLDNMIAEAVATGRLRATGSAAEAVTGGDVSLICVGTPSSSTGGAELSFVKAAMASVVETLSVPGNAPATGRHHVLVRSTVPPGTVDATMREVLATSPPLPDGVEVLSGMCPEFLREGSGISDFYAPPFLVVGAADARVAEAMAELFSFLDVPVTPVETPTAEALKYTCNAFHATKVSFANEIGRLFRPIGVDARAVMELFCRDTQLNVSPTYLRPGFAFGGSCLPKDLRSMLHMARMRSTDLPLLSGALATNDLCVRDIVDRVLSYDARVVVMFGLAFKMSSDDLRESPYVELAERLLGKGHEVRIYDPIIKPSRLTGTNRQYIDSKLPHLRALLCSDPDIALSGADLAIVASSDITATQALRRQTPSTIIDLNGRLGQEIEALPGYVGVSW